jgi:hypothetical protein
MPIRGLSFSNCTERPGASADQGQYAGRIELANVKPRPLPDLSQNTGMQENGVMLNWLPLHAKSNGKIRTQQLLICQAML